MKELPAPPPYPVGTRVRYVGERRLWRARVPHPRPLDSHPEDWCEFGPGFETTIVDVVPGHRGTGAHLRDDDGPMYDDDGEPILDETSHGRSVYEVDTGIGKVLRLCILHESAHEWEVVASRHSRQR